MKEGPHENDRAFQILVSRMVADVVHVPSRLQHGRLDSVGRLHCGGIVDGKDLRKGINPMTRQEKSACTRQANALRAVAQWNALVPIGSPVTVELDSGEIRATTTRSNAQILGAEPSRNDPGHTAVIFLDGITGWYNLSRVRPKGGLSRA